MAKRRRELLKFRDGDVGLKIRKDGQLELAGISEKHGMIDKNGMVNPAMLFASAWARRDPKVFQVLVDNFKESVREGYFGPEAKADYERADAVAKKEKEEKEKEVEKPLLPFLNPGPKPTVDVASGSVTFEQPKPLTTQVAVDRRDS